MLADTIIGVSCIVGAYWIVYGVAALLDWNDRRLYHKHHGNKGQ